MHYRFSRGRDTEEIGDFIARDTPTRAVTFIAELRQRCSDQPGRDTRFSIGIASTRDNLRSASALPGFLPVSISAR